MYSFLHFVLFLIISYSCFRSINRDDDLGSFMRVFVAISFAILASTGIINLLLK